MKVLNFIAMLFLILTVGCKKDDGPVSQVDSSADVIVPLAVGNQWTYIDSIYTVSGTFEKVDTIKLGITGKRTVIYEGKSTDVFYWNWYTDNKPDTTVWLCRNEAGGCFGYGMQYSESNYIISKTPWLKFPASVGDSWKSLGYSYNDSTRTYTADTSIYTCTSINEKLKTAKGEMESYVFNTQYSYSGQKYSLDMYFVKNIGYVGLVLKIDGVIVEKYVLLSNTTGVSTAKTAAHITGQKNGKKRHSMFNIK